METALYLELNLFGILVLGLLWWNLSRSGATTVDERLFRRIVLCVMALMALDALGWVFDGSPLVCARGVLLIINTLVFLMIGLLSFLWMLYADYRLYASFEGLKRRARVYCVPLALLTLATLTNPFTELIFYITPGNVYCRGGFFFAFTTIAWLMLAYTGVLALVKTHREPLRAKRAEYRLIALFVFFPFAAGIAQAFMYGLSLVWLSCALSLLAIFIYMQNRQISLDGLTNINNRRTLNRYLDARLTELKGDETVTLIMIDIDDFKHINDTYGHTAGDEVLKRMADMLKKVCGGGNDFLSRYGGDEFAIVCRAKTDEQVRETIRALRAEAYSPARESSIPSFGISAGYATVLANGARSVEWLIAEADRNMYTDKNGD